MIATYLVCVIVILLSFLAHLAIKRYNYWKWRNVPHLKPSFLFGSFKNYLYLKEDASYVEHKICEQFPDEPYIGVLYGTEPTLIVQDPELIGLITSKEFSYFNGREISRYCPQEILTNCIFYVYGERWKISNQASSHLFSSSKLKNMFHMIDKCASDLEKLLDDKVKVGPNMDMRNIMAKYTMDCIGSCILGINANTLSPEVNNEVNPFRVIGDKIFEGSKLRNFLYIVRSMWPAVFYGLGFKAFPKEIHLFFLNLYKDVCKNRDYKPSSRNDIIDHFLADTKDDDLVIGLLTALFGAGYETSSTTMSHTLYELARNEEAQNLAIKEVDEYLTRTGGKLTYECVNELKYLDACTNEAMRLYPVLGVITREVMQDYTLPTGLRLEKGVRIHLPVYHIHRKPEFYPEPEKFRPERFLNDSIKPYTYSYMAYGEGRRMCVGKRFSKMQMLPGLVTILKNYRVSVADSMPVKIEYEVGNIVTTPKGPIVLQFTPRKKS